MGRRSVGSEGTRRALDWYMHGTATDRWTTQDISSCHVVPP